MKSAESGSLQNFEFVRSKSADCLHSADFRSDSADFRSDSADFNLLLCARNLQTEVDDEPLKLFEPLLLYVVLAHMVAYILFQLQQHHVEQFYYTV